MNDTLKKFINENIDLINQNTKESWEAIYRKIAPAITGEFTEIILSVGISDPASILGYIPGWYLSESKISNYKIPNNVTSVDYGAFNDCSNLISIKIPNDVTSIGVQAFSGCDSLTSITIPDGVKDIRDSAFFYCNNLTNVEIPDSVKRIGDFAFAFCDSLKEINFKGTKKQAITLGIGNGSKEKWRENSAIQKIICNDGEIIL